MNIIEQISRTGRQLQARFDGYRDSAVANARRTIAMTASSASAAKTPVRTLANAAERVNDLSHRYFGQLVEMQAKNLEVAIEAGADRLKRLTQVENLRGLIADQVRLNPASRARIKRDVKDTWTLTANTGREFGSIAVETYAQLIRGAKPIQKPARTRKRRTVRSKSTKSARPS